MTFNEDSELEVPAEKAAKARNYIVIGGEEAAIEIGGQSIRIPVSPKGTRAVTIPANIEKDFRIRAEKGTRIVEVSVPVRRETFEAALDFEVVPGTEGHRVARDVVFTSSEEPLIHDTYERTTIVKGAYGFSWDERHQVSIMVQRGSVDIVIEGENPIPLEAGEVFVPPQYSPKFEVVNRGAEAAVVKIDYKNTLAEDILFANTDAIRKHIQEIAALGKTNVVMLSETFAEGGANDPGSRDWWERMFHTYVNPNITIIPYWSESRKGVEVTGMDAAIAEMKKLDPSETNILIATESKIQNATDENRKIMKRFRTIGIPDLDMDEIDGEANPLKDGIRNMGWFFTREALGAALLLSIVTPQGVFFDEGVDSTAYDMQRFMRVVLGREVSRGDICYMLPHEEVERAMPDATARWKQSGREVPEWFNKIKEDLKDLKAWFTSLLKKALLAMPIRAFDTNEDILRRHQNLFKAAKAA